MISAETSAKTSDHYNDWPNSQGFDTNYEEREPVELRVEGNIPPYAAGILFRTGLGPRSVDCGEKGVFRTNHWFDNFAQVHRFQIHPPETPDKRIRVTYNSRLTSDGLIEQVRRVGKLEGLTFAAKYEPCKTFFQKLQSMFTPARKSPKPNEVNVGVTMSINYPGLSATGEAKPEPQDTSKITSFCTKTDAAIVQMLDSETLEPVGLAEQHVLHPELTGAVSGAHAKSDPVTGDVFNYNLTFGGTGTYKIFKTSAATGTTSILATLRHTTAYLHSLWLTENYVVICIWNSHYVAGGSTILWKKNLIEAMTYNDSVPAKWWVIDKTAPSDGGKGVVATYESEPFFGFHTVNAYEEKAADGTIQIIADIPVYQSLQILNSFYFENILSDSPEAAQYKGKWGTSLGPVYRRYRLPNIPCEPREGIRKVVVEFELTRADTPELPALNRSVFTKRHRFVYGIHDSGKSTLSDGIVKLDLENHTVKRWSEHGQTAGEAIFIADPQGTEEDDGVLLTVVLDGIEGKSYLLVLNAKDLNVMGKAHVDGVIGFGFHGLHTRQGLGDQVSSISKL